MQKMKTNHLIYLLSLIMLIGSIFIVLEYKDSQRMQMLAGFMIIIGIAINITGFAMKKR